MDLTALKIFKTVVEQGRVTRAAAALHRVQSNVTTRVKQLEKKLGATLFNRQGRKLVLSPEGKVLFAYAERLLSLSSETHRCCARAGWRRRLRSIRCRRRSRRRRPCWCGGVATSRARSTPCANS